MTLDEIRQNWLQQAEKMNTEVMQRYHGKGSNLLLTNTSYPAPRNHPQMKETRGV